MNRHKPEACKRCKRNVERCQLCQTVAVCKMCDTEQDEQGHQDFCGQIQQQREKYQTLKEEQLQPMQTSNDVCEKLADETFRLVDKMLEATFKKQLLLATVDDMVNLLTYQGIEKFWGHDYIKLLIPALCICQNEDQKAYAFALWFLRPHDGPFEFAKSKDHSMFEDVNLFVENTISRQAWIFRAPLTLIKFRLLKDLRYLQQRPQRLQDLRGHQRPYVLRPGGPQRTSGMKRFLRENDLADRIAKLEGEIEILAKFPDDMGPAWEDFWELMFYRPEHAWVPQDRPESIPDAMRQVIKANYHSWFVAPEAFQEMSKLGFIQ
ncbi:hypothetical protein VB005_03022 [Metarhizium brunneum]